MPENYRCRRRLSSERRRYIENQMSRLEAFPTLQCKGDMKSVLFGKRTFKGEIIFKGRQSRSDSS